MKAAVVEEAGKLTIKELDMPVAGDYDVLCETRYGAVCTGTDTHILNQDPPFCNWLKLPAILGHESIGHVIEAGLKVKNFKLGDLITRVGCPGVDEIGSAWGGFAEYAIGKDWQAMKADGLDEADWKSHTVNQMLPKGVDAAAGTMFITWRETLSYMNRIGAREGCTFLVIGSGSNGLAMANHAVNLGAEKVIMIGSAIRTEESQRVGCSAFIDYKAADVKEQTLALSPDGYDIVADVVGTPATASLGLACVANGGTLGIYGLDNAGAIILNPDLSKGTFTLYKGGYDEGETHQQVCDFVKAGKLDASIWVDESKAFSLDDIGKAFEAVTNRTLIKPLIKIKG